MLEDQSIKFTRGIPSPKPVGGPSVIAAGAIVVPTDLQILTGTEICEPRGHTYRMIQTLLRILLTPPRNRILRVSAFDRFFFRGGGAHMLSVGFILNSDRGREDRSRFAEKLGESTIP